MVETLHPELGEVSRMGNLLDSSKRVSPAADSGLPESKLLRWDWILLPLISLLTISLLSVSVELVARRKFRLSSQPDACLTLKDPSAGVRGIPNSVCSQISPDNRLVEYRFNSSGHRAGMDLKPKAPGTYRIVMVGSSAALGAYVPREESFAALLPQELSEQTGRNVELYNEAIFMGSPNNVITRFSDARAAQPDMILWPLTPWDMYDKTAWDGHPAVPALLGFMGQTRYRVKQALTKHSILETATALMDTFRDYLSSTQTHAMMSHFLYQSQSEYVKLYLLGSDEESGYLKAKSSAEWQKRLQKFDTEAADVEARAKAVGVPLVVVLIPSRAQSAMISMGQWPQGYDPYKLNEDLRAIVTSHGGTYVDMVTDFRMIPNPEQGYFPVDGHPNAKGHAVISAVLARELTGGVVPALKVSAQLQAASEQRR